MAGQQTARRVPLRKCIVCGVKTDKRGLIRIVAPQEGPVEVDATGKARGRGAYVCRSGGMEHDRLGRGRLDHSLRRKLTEEEWSALVSSIGAARDTEQR